MNEAQQAAKIIQGSKTQETEAPRFRLVRACDLEPRPMDWLISGLFERDSLVQIFGLPGGAKTFTILDMACCIATGKDYHGRQVQSGPVVYVCGEGSNGIARRLKAWQIANGISLDDQPLYVSTMPAALLDTVNLSAVVGAINETGCTPVMVVLDTIARNFGPGDENSTKDMTGFVRACDEIRSAWGCTVSLVHHTGHGATERARGSSVLNGALDAAYRADKGADGIVTITCTKAKDFPAPAPFAFRFQSVELSILNDDGSPATSAVLVPTNMPSPKQAPKGKHQQTAVEVLRKQIDQHRAELQSMALPTDNARAKREDWRQACIEQGIPPNRFADAENALKAKGITRHEFAFVYLE